MKLTYLLLFIFIFSLAAYGQQTKVYGKVFDAKTKAPIDFAKVGFDESEVSTFSKEDGSFSIETYYASDSLVVFSFGYKIAKQKIQLDKSQEVTIYLTLDEDEIEGVVIKASGDPPAIRILKRIIRNKPINNKKKLESYDYELYNKIQMDINNLDDQFGKGGVVKKLDFVLNYLDSNDKEGKTLPILLTESVSDFYYLKSPPKKREVLKATRITGIEDLQINQLLGDIYMDINIYENYIDLFQRAFVSPISNAAKNFYNYTLVDSMYIDNHFYFQIDFKPKRSGETTFEGTMLINDTTFAVKEFKANLSAVANVNFINGMYIEQYYDQVENEVWMQTHERLVIDLNLVKDAKTPGLYLRKSSSRYNFKINEVHSTDFYNSNSSSGVLEGARNRSDAYWDSIRRTPLSLKEENINIMVDSLNNTPYFNLLKNSFFFLATGYYPLGEKLELGDLYNFVSTNPIEKFKMNISLRTSNNFSKIIEIGGRIGYGFYDRKIKGGGLVRINLSQRKRALLSIYANSDIEQYGSGTSAGNTFGNIAKSAPLDKLFYVNKTGLSIEKDAGKDFILNFSAETRQIRSLGLAQFERLNSDNEIQPINTLKTTEFTFGFSWGKDRQFIDAVYSRALIGSRYPILTLETTVGAKGILGSQYNYQRFTFKLDHTRNTGAVGRISYGFSVGKYFGTAAYPFLKIHEGGQTFWFLKNAYNKMNYFEFISDTYADAYLEHHFQGLILDRIPGVKKLKWRLVVHSRATWGMLSNKQNDAVMMPSFTRRFGDTPYVEAGFGIENIFKFFRVDLIYRATHHVPGVNPLGVRIRFDVII